MDMAWLGHKVWESQRKWNKGSNKVKFLPHGTRPMGWGIPDKKTWPDGSFALIFTLWNRENGVQHKWLGAGCVMVVMKVHVH